MEPIQVRKPNKIRRYNREIDVDMWDDVGLKSLMAGICIRAVRDYRLAFEGHVVDYKQPHVTKEQCLDFFDSPIFQNFVHIPPDEVAKTIEGMDSLTFYAIAKHGYEPESQEEQFYGD